MSAITERGGLRLNHQNAAQEQPLPPGFREQITTGFRKMGTLFTGRLEQESQRIDPEKIFAPGNLVHGTQNLWLKPERMLTEGIKRGIDVVDEPNEARVLYTPHIICFSLLNDQPLPDRYLESSHYGPRREPDRYYCADDGKIAVVVSRATLLQTYPTQVFAVGSAFWKNTFWTRWNKMKPLKGQSFYDIPVMYTGETVLKDEVRLYPKKKGRKEDENDPLIVPADAILGLVTLEASWDYLKKYKFSGVCLNRKIPVFSPKCEQIDTIG